MAKTKQTTKPTKEVAKVETKKVADNLAYKSVAELLDMARNLRRDIVLSRLAVRSGRQPNTRKGFNDRKQLARVLTALSDKKNVTQPEAKV